MTRLSRSVLFQTIVMVAGILVASWGAIVIANVWWQEAWSGQAEANPLWGWILLPLGLIMVTWSIVAIVRTSRRTRPRDLGAPGSR